MKIAILYYQFLDEDGRQRRIGGVETYIYNLSRLLASKGYDVTVCQGSATKFRAVIDDVQVIGLGGVWPHRNQIRRAFLLTEATAALSLDSQRDVLIFAADQCSVRNHFTQTIGIQHGVSWDLPTKYLTASATLNRRVFASAYKAYIKYRALRNFERSHYRVCVDYNFLNWYKTVASMELDYSNIYVIPNFADSLAGVLSESAYTRPVSIIFARRYYEYRGTRIAALALKRISLEFPNIHITFAGEGPDEGYLRDMFHGCSLAEFVKYDPTDATRIIGAHSICIVPSLACEGTSYSVIEAMASGCAVVASAVGGITNIICDEFNGLLVSPTVESLYMGIKRLIVDNDLRAKLIRNAIETVRASFSRNKWESSWLEVMADVRRSSEQSYRR